MARLDEFVRAHGERIVALWCGEAERASFARRLGHDALLAPLAEQVASLARPAAVGETALPPAVVERAVAVRLRQGFRVCDLAEEYALLERAVCQAWAESLPPGERPPPVELSRLHDAIAGALQTALPQAHHYLLEEQQLERRHLDRIARLAPDGALSVERMGELLGELRAAMAARAVSLLWWGEGAFSVGGSDGELECEGEALAVAEPLIAAAAARAVAEFPSEALGAAGERLVKKGVRGVLGQPLAPRRELLGVVVACFAEPPPCHLRLRLRLEALCERMALLVDNARLIERTRAHLQALEEERALQERLVGMMAHDLRGPLTVALFGAQLLLQRPSGDERVFLTEKVIHSIQRADRMLRDLLDYSRVRAGEPLPLVLAPCDLGELARAVCDELAVTHGRHRFRLTIEPRVEGVWSADALSRAIWNLVQNGLKYGAADRPVTVTVGRIGEGACVSVHNHGAPMDPGELGRVFEPYHQGRRARGGWGLGLALVRACAEAHHGRVEVESLDGVGTTFTLRLPLDARQALADSPTVH